MAEGGADGIVSGLNSRRAPGKNACYACSMKKALLLLCSALAWAQNPSPAAPPRSVAASGSDDPVVLTVGAEKITRSGFEEIIKTLPEQQKEQVTTPEGKRKLAGQLSELLTLAQEARARKLDQSPGVMARVTLQTDEVLANAAFQALGTPDDAALEAYYEAHKDQTSEVHARHILIRFKGSRVPLRPGQADLTDEEALAKAKEVRAKIAAGGKFEEIAKAESDDTGSGQDGGNLDPFTKGTMTPLFEEAAFSLPIGELSQPVKTEFGYHIIRVESRTARPFAAVREDLIEQLGQDQAKKGLEDLKKKTPVILDETYFGK